jgi:uncharacterized delta-60 repeat protein
MSACLHRALLLTGFLLTLQESPGQSDPRIESILLLPDGQAAITVAGSGDTEYVVETSDDLIGWDIIKDGVQQQIEGDKTILTVPLNEDWHLAFFRVSDGPGTVGPTLDIAGTVGPAGGELSGHEGSVVLDFPAGAVTENLDIRISPIASVGVPGVITTRIFDFGPDGTTFDKPVIVTLSYEGIEFPPDVELGDLLYAIGTSHETGELIPLPGAEVDSVAKTVSVPINGFSVVGMAINCSGAPIPPFCPPVCFGDPPEYEDDSGGGLDPSFGNGGIFSFELGIAGATGVDDLLIDEDGRILLALERTRMGVGRILPNGEGFDPDFGLEGIAELSPDEFDNTPRSIALRTDGRLVLHGAQQPPGGGLKLQLARFLPNGTLDATFGDNGVLLDERQGITLDGSLTTMPDGRLFITDTGARSLYQFLPEGEPDPTFGNNGIATNSRFFDASPVLRRAGGEWLIARGNAIQEVDSQGSLGQVFGSIASRFFAKGFQELPGGGYVMAGGRVSGFGPSSAWTPAVARFQPGEEFGSLEPDICFGTDEFNVGSGVRSYSFGGSEFVSDLAVQADGRILLAGNTTDRGGDDDLFVIRVRPDGEIDAGFGSNGIVYLDFGGDEQGGSIALDDQGRIVVAGSSSVDNSRAGVVARLLP